MDIILVHGYNVTSTKTYGVLPQRLKAAGHKIKDVYLSKYVTLDDGVHMSDLARALDAAFQDFFRKRRKKSGRSFACITHSTGGLLLRSWIETFYGARINALPLSHLIMLSPPNHGSRLACVGKSKLGRLRNMDGVEAGVKILAALKTGSRVQWDLNSEWIHQKYQSARDFYPFVITGQWIDTNMVDPIIPTTSERGSDGVVRAASANLNMTKFLFSPDGSLRKKRIRGVPFLILPRTSHTGERHGIMRGFPLKEESAFLQAIFQALRVNSPARYARCEKDFSSMTEQTQTRETYFDGSPLERYSQAVFCFRDNMGNAINDYAVEFLDEDGHGGRFPAGTFCDSFQNPDNPEFFSFFLNYDRLAEMAGGKIGFRVRVTASSLLVSYSDFVAAPIDVGEFIKPNQTTCIDVILRRRLNKEMFRLTKNFSYQKIKGHPGDEWIE